MRTVVIPLLQTRLMTFHSRVALRLEILGRRQQLTVLQNSGPKRGSLLPTSATITRCARTCHWTRMHPRDGESSRPTQVRWLPCPTSAGCITSTCGSPPDPFGRHPPASLLKLGRALATATKSAQRKTSISVPAAAFLCFDAHSCRVIVTFGAAWHGRILSATPFGKAGWSFQ